MFRIDSPGATITNLFTEGNPSLGIPATEVSDDWLNDTVQEELVRVVETDAGLTLNKLDNTQLSQALNIIIGLGGTSQLSFAVANNVGPLDVTSLVFNSVNVKAAHMHFDLERRTDSQDVNETGELRVSFNNETSTWALDIQSSLDDAGVVFSIDGSGQVQYTSDDLTGTNYSGTLRVAQILNISQ